MNKKIIIPLILVGILLIGIGCIGPFAEDEYELTINIEGEGETTPGEGIHTYEAGEEVTITATPAAGWRIDEFRGDIPNNSNNPENNSNNSETNEEEPEIIIENVTQTTGDPKEINITIDEDKEITVVFERLPAGVDHLQEDFESNYDIKAFVAIDCTIEDSKIAKLEIRNTGDITIDRPDGIPVYHGATHVGDIYIPELDVGDEDHFDFNTTPDHPEDLDQGVVYQVVDEQFPSIMFTCSK